MTIATIPDDGTSRREKSGTMSSECFRLLSPVLSTSSIMILTGYLLAMCTSIESGRCMEDEVMAGFPAQLFQKVRNN